MKGFQINAWGPLLNAFPCIKVGRPLVAAAADTAVFLDRTTRRICRPGGDPQNQRAMYNCHHKVHCLQYQGVSAQEGMIIDFYGPVAGRRHDSHVRNASLFNERFRQVQVGKPVQYKYYADKGYYPKSHGYCAFRGSNRTENLRQENERVSPRRVGIEWAFGKIGNASNYSTKTQSLDDFCGEDVQVGRNII